MKQTIKIDMGEFLRTVTQQLDCSPKERYETVRIVFAHNVVWFRKDWLNNILRLLNGIFYRCYGGWHILLGYTSVGDELIYNGTVYFKPTCQDASIGI